MLLESELGGRSPPSLAWRALGGLGLLGAGAMLLASAWSALEHARALDGWGAAPLAPGVLVGILARAGRVAEEVVRRRAAPAGAGAARARPPTTKESTMNMKTEANLVAWLAARVTDDPRALRWFDHPDAEPRIARAYRELLSGYAVDPSTVLSTTRALATGEVAGVVEVRDITFFSICAHHFLPFFGTASVAYWPGARIIGLGKLPRLVEAFARRFQIQEDLTRSVAETLMQDGGAHGARVVTEASHLCMCSRGPSQPGSRTRVEVALGTLGAG